MRYIQILSVVALMTSMVVGCSSDDESVSGPGGFAGTGGEAGGTGGTAGETGGSSGSGGDAGSSGSGGDAGSGGSGGSAGEAGTGGSGGCAEEDMVCPPGAEVCSHTFETDDNSYTSVEVRGTLPGMDWNDGPQMQLSGTTWTLTQQLPVGTTGEYKYVADESTWIPDGMGNNMQLGPISCAEPECTEELVCPGENPIVGYDWRDAVIYFVFVDRFVDGDPSTNCNVAGVSTEGNNIRNYKGGDWKGVTEKINAGYFDDLGVNTLWLTVPLKNSLSAGAGHSTGRHPERLHLLELSRLLAADGR